MRDHIQRTFLIPLIPFLIIAGTAYSAANDEDGLIKIPKVGGVEEVRIHGDSGDGYGGNTPDWLSNERNNACQTYDNLC